MIINALCWGVLDEVDARTPYKNNCLGKSNNKERIMDRMELLVCNSRTRDFLQVLERPFQIGASCSLADRYCSLSSSYCIYFFLVGHTY